MRNCDYCRTMAELHLPGHWIELHHLARFEMKNCVPTPPGQLPYLDFCEQEFRLLPDHADLSNVMGMRRFARLQHLRWHRRTGTNCHLAEQLWAQVARSEYAETYPELRATA